MMFYTIPPNSPIPANQTAECGIERPAWARSATRTVRRQHCNSAFRTSHSAFRFLNWFNSVNATYRADLRELSEFNFARFDAKLGQRIAELKSELLKWMFLFWATTGLALGGLFFRK